MSGFANLARGGLAVLGVLLGAFAVRGEVQTIDLPGDYADFALHPETGTIAALSAETNEAIFFRAADLAAGSAEPAARVRVGSTPCSVFYKRYQDMRVFAVVCSLDSHIYLINAGGPGTDREAEFALLEKIELSQSGVSYVTGSINPDDPFLYYCYGSGHDSTTGVVSLRDRRAQGAAFDDSMDCAISASGEVGYRRGPWSPSGFESLIRANSLAEDKPVFHRLFYDHNSTAQYVPDPFDRYTAAGTRIFSRGLEKNEAGLDFVPLCFFQTRPVIVGISGGNAVSRIRSSSDASRNVTLRAASYNTFTNVGDQVVLAYQAPDGERGLPRGVPSQADFKSVMKRPRLFADDARERVVYADGNRLYLVPLAEFKLPDEPFLLATLEGATELFARQENRLKLKPLDDRIQITLDDMPEGMESDGGTLVWTPDPDQIGPATIVATIRHSDIQRTLRFDLEVVYPCVKLPFAPANFAVDAEGKHAVIWDGPTLDRFGRLQGNAPITAMQIAVLDLATGKVNASRQIAEQIGRAILTERYAILVPASNGSPKCEILRIDDLERERALVASGPILHLHVADDQLIIQTQSAIEVFDGASFDRLKSFPAAGASPASALTQHGLFVQGVLYGFDLKPKLIVDPRQLPALGGARNVGIPSFPLNPTAAGRQQPMQARPFPGGQGQSRIATQDVPGRNISVSLDLRQHQIQVPGATHTWRNEFELALTASGAVDERQVVVRRQLHAQTANQPGAPPAVLQVSKNEAFVLHDKDLYRWPIPAAKEEETGKAETLSWMPQQSELALTGTGKTELKHAIRGGKPPVQYSTLTSFDAIRIDEASGTVMIDEEAILTEAAQTLEGIVKQRNRGESFVQTLRGEAVAMIEQATHMLGRNPTGFPVAVPIQVTASDADLATARLQYFVIAEVPSKDVLERLQQLDREREKQMAELQAARERAAQQAPAGTPPGDAGELGEIKRRLEAVEQRLDLLTRQLNMLLKRLDEQE